MEVFSLPRRKATPLQDVMLVHKSAIQAKHNGELPEDIRFFFLGHCHYLRWFRNPQSKLFGNLWFQKALQMCCQCPQKEEYKLHTEWQFIIFGRPSSNFTWSQLLKMECYQNHPGLRWPWPSTICSGGTCIQKAACRWNNCRNADGCGHGNFGKLRLGRKRWSVGLIPDLLRIAPNVAADIIHPLLVKWTITKSEPLMAKGAIAADLYKRSNSMLSMLKYRTIILSSFIPKAHHRFLTHRLLALSQCLLFDSQASGRTGGLCEIPISQMRSLAPKSWRLGRSQQASLFSMWKTPTILPSEACSQLGCPLKMIAQNSPSP